MEGENSSTQELELMRQLFGARQTGTATVNVNLGGSGVWIAVTACVSTLAACIPLGIVLTIAVVDQGRRIDRMQDHLTAIYMMAPHLQPQPDRKKAP